MLGWFSAPTFLSLHEGNESETRFSLLWYCLEYLEMDTKND